MGFFSDLKEDLSQAVNELLPEEELKKAKNDNAEEQDVIEVSVDDMEQLDALLERVDSIEVPEDMDITKIEEDAADLQADEVQEIEEIKEVEEADEEFEEEEEFEDNDLEASIRAAFGEKEETVTGGTKMDIQVKNVSDETAIITAGMTITGDIISEGSIEVIGTIMGNVEALGKLNVTGVINGNSKAAEVYADTARITGEVVSEGAIKIGQSSVIIGNIVGKSAVIAGAIKGDIDVHGPVVLDASAIVMGNIKSQSVQINNGAVIEGMCSQCYADVNPTSFFEDYKKTKK